MWCALVGKALGRLPKEPDNPSPPATPTAQYSPSVSHDEEEDPTTPVHNEVEGPGLGDSEEESFVLQADSSVDNLLKELEPAIVQPLAVGGWEEEGEGEGEEEGEGEGEGGWGAGVDVRDDGGAKKRMDYQPNTNEVCAALLYVCAFLSVCLSLSLLPLRFSPLPFSCMRVNVCVCVLGGRSRRMGTGR